MSIISVFLQWYKIDKNGCKIYDFTPFLPIIFPLSCRVTLLLYIRSIRWANITKNTSGYRQKRLVSPYLGIVVVVQTQIFAFFQQIIAIFHISKSKMEFISNQYRSHKEIHSVKIKFFILI